MPVFLKLIQETFKPKPTEVEVNYTGQKVWLSMSNKNITASDILWIQKEHGYNTACWVLYKYFKENPKATEFFQFIETHKQNYSHAFNDYTVVVWAHNPWATRSMNEEYQWRLKNIAADMGFNVFVPDIGYRRSLFANAYALQESLKRFQAPQEKKLLFLTQGVGSLECKWFLQKSQVLPKNILGWLNVSGLLYGTALPPTQSRAAKAVLDFVGSYPINPDVLRSNSYCRQPLQHDLPMISMIPISPASRFTFKDRWANEDLKHWGPHDGFTSLVDYISSPGIVWPIWGETHFIDVEIYKNRMQAAFKYLLQQQEILKTLPILVEDHLQMDFK